MEDRAELLASCYRNSMKLAHQYGVKSIAFPAISTGVYCYPLEEATDIAVSEVQTAMYLYKDIERVVLCCFDSATFDVYKRRMGMK